MRLHIVIDDSYIKDLAMLGGIGANFPPYNTAKDLPIIEPCLVRWTSMTVKRKGYKAQEAHTSDSYSEIVLLRCSDASGTNVRAAVAGSRVVFPAVRVAPSIYCLPYELHFKARLRNTAYKIVSSKTLIFNYKN